MKSVFKTPTHHALTRNIHVLRKIIRVIREIRVQTPYASQELNGIITSPENIRVIREIRVQNPYAPRLNKDIRVSRQKKNPWSDLPSNCLETRIVHCFVGSGHSRAKIRDFI